MFRSRKPNRNDTSPDQPAALGDDMLVLVEQAVHPFIVLLHDPSGFRAEQVRGLRNKLIAMNPDGTSKTLVVTSAIRGEGKSVTAINLAMAFAETERLPILLIDGDLRGPSIHRYLNLNSELGFADVLMDRCSIDEALCESGFRSLYVMGAGTHVGGPSEVISAAKVEQLLARLKERFQYTILDTPPALPATDASVMAARADGCLLVVRLEHSSKTLTREAIRNLRDLGANMLGTFVTEVRGADPEADARWADSSSEDF